MGQLLTQNPSWFWSSFLINECINFGIKRFFIAPGMRNVPLIAALTRYQKCGGKTDIEFSWSIDERALSYQALGYAQVTGLPCALLCTSGTALANFYPAFIEAHKSGIPLLVISADRPAELAYSDVNQSINQHNFFQSYSRENLNLWPADSSEALEYSSSAILHTLNRSMAPYPGPIHINIPLSEPLNEKEAPLSANIKAYLSNKKEHPQTPTFKSSDFFNLELNKEVAAYLQSFKKPLLIFGHLNPLERQSILDQISNIKVPFIADIASGIKLSINAYNALSLPGPDHLETLQILEENPPDIVIHVGGKMISKNYSLLAKKWNDKKIPLWQFCHFPFGHNPSGFFKQIDAPKSSLPSLLSLFTESSFTYDWDKDSLIASLCAFIQKKADIIDNSPWSYPALSKSFTDFIFQNEDLPEIHLFLGNSTVARAFDCYHSHQKLKKSTAKTYTHRGVSGIEGNMASTLGIALASKETLKSPFLPVAIIGDMAFLHDLNSLFDLGKCEVPLIVIVVNNSGGGIFTLLPISQSPDILNIITTPHQYHFENAVKNFNLTYYQANDKKSFLETFKRASQETILKSTPIIIETCFSSTHNKMIYEKLKTRE